MVEICRYCNSSDLEFKGTGFQKICECKTCGQMGSPRDVPPTELKNYPEKKKRK